MLDRNFVKNLIINENLRVKKFISWEHVRLSKQNGILLESNSTGVADWFYVIKGKSIWWISSDTSDGGLWNSEGVEVEAYKIQYNESIRIFLDKLIEFEQKNSLSNNSYHSARMK